MKTPLVIITDNVFYFLAMTEIVSSHPALDNKYKLLNVRSDNIASWLDSSPDEAIIAAGPDMKHHVHFICLIKRYDHLRSDISVTDVKKFLSKDLNHLLTDRSDPAWITAPHKLTGKEMNVLLWHLRGLKPCQMSWRYGLSVKTISIHKRRLMRKMHISSDVELYSIAKCCRLLKLH